MEKALKDAITICKTLLRNGYDAHVINAPVQEHLLKHSKQLAVDIACEPDLETLLKLFPEARVEPDQRAIAQMEKDGVLFRFYALEVEDASHPELSLLRITPTMANMMDPQERLQLRMTGFGSPAPTGDVYDGFMDVKGGLIQLTGLPDETLRHNYLLAIRALRFAANFDIPIEPNTWLAIVRSSTRVLDYVPAADIMDEWRKVAAESMYRFVKLMFDAHILQGLIPEVAALACIRQRRNDDDDTEETVFDHTLESLAERMSPTRPSARRSRISGIRVLRRYCCTSGKASWGSTSSATRGVSSSTRRRTEASPLGRSARSSSALGRERWAATGAAGAGVTGASPACPTVGALSSASGAAGAASSGTGLTLCKPLWSAITFR